MVLGHSSVVLAFIARELYKMFRHQMKGYRSEWSLWAYASMRAVRLFLRARTVINFLMRAASTLEITNGEQRALTPPAGISLYQNVVLRQVISLTLSKQDNRHKARQHDKGLSRFNHSQWLIANYALFNMKFPANVFSFSFTRVSRWTLNGIWSKF